MTFELPSLAYDGTVGKFSMQKNISHVLREAGGAGGLGHASATCRNRFTRTGSDDALARDGDLAENGQSVARKKIELRMSQFRMGDKLGESSVITWKIFLKSILTSKIGEL